MKTQKYKYVGKKPLKWRGKEYDGSTATKDVERLLKEFPILKIYFKLETKGEKK